MEKRIDLEKRARKPNQIKELNLDNCRSTSIIGLTDEFTALETLSLINVGLTTLKGFPKLPNLKKLELSDNRISNGLNYLTTSPKLQYLTLSGNKISDLETLKPLQEFKELMVLDLFNNDICETEGYRKSMFEMLPSLKILDGFDINDKETPFNRDSEDDDEQTAFCLNGLEIDLAELEELERRVEAKKKLSNTTTAMVSPHSSSSNGTVMEDDLDLYLKELKLKEENKSINDSVAIAQGSKELMVVDNSEKPHPPYSDCSKAATGDQSISENVHKIKFIVLLYWFLAIINLAQAALYKNSDLEDEGEEEDDDDEGDAEDGEDSEDGEEEGDESDEDEEIESEDEEEEGDGATENDKPTKATKTSAAKVSADGKANANDSQARGKKRKHEAEAE